MTPKDVPTHWGQEKVWPPTKNMASKGGLGAKCKIPPKFLLFVFRLLGVPDMNPSGKCKIPTTSFWSPSFRHLDLR